jgi:hypothetical protein
VRLKRRLSGVIGALFGAQDVTSLIEKFFALRKVHVYDNIKLCGLLFFIAAPMFAYSSEMIFSAIGLY